MDVYHTEIIHIQGRTSCRNLGRGLAVFVNLFYKQKTRRVPSALFPNTTLLAYGKDARSVMSCCQVLHQWGVQVLRDGTAAAAAIKEYAAWILGYYHVIR